jgi:opacity protein-like surface antigen
MIGMLPGSASMRVLAIATSLAGLLAAPSAWGESPLGLYVGGGVGSASVAVESKSDNLFPSYVEGEGDTLPELHVGYRFLRHVGAELTYFDTQPSWDSLAFGPRQREVYRNTAALDFRTTQVSVIGVLPFGRIWEAYARGGIAFWQADANQTQIRFSDGAVAARSISSSGDGMVIGLGVGASPTPAWHIRVEMQSFEVNPNLVLATRTTTLDSWLLLFDYRFGSKRTRDGD